MVQSTNMEWTVNLLLHDFLSDDRELVNVFLGESEAKQLELKDF